MESIHCLVMLEDQSEERACLYALGLLEETDVRAFEEDAAHDENLRRVVTELEETLTNLSLSTTPIHLPSDQVRRSVLDRIEAEPARVETDRWGRVETINPAFTRLCGYRIEDLRGRKAGELLQGPATDPATVEALRAAVRDGYACTVEMVNYHRDGSPYKVRIAIEPLRNRFNELSGFTAIEHHLGNLDAA